MKSRKFNSTTKSSAVRVAEAKLRVAQRNLRKALREDASKGFVACERDWDDDVNCALLPEGSIYAGKYIVYSISSQGMWKAAAVIVDNLDTSKLIDCNPFYDVDELREEGFKVVKKLRKSEGYSSDEPVTFKISPNETYIDFYDYDEDEF